MKRLILLLTVFVLFTSCYNFNTSNDDEYMTICKIRGGATHKYEYTVFSGHIGIVLFFRSNKKYDIGDMIVIDFKKPEEIGTDNK